MDSLYISNVSQLLPRGAAGLRSEDAIEGLQAFKAASFLRVECSEVPADMLMSRDFWKHLYAILREEGACTVHTSESLSQHSEVLLSNLKLVGFPASSIAVTDSQITASKPKRQAAGLLKNRQKVQ